MKLEKFTKKYELLINPDLNDLLNKIDVRNLETTKITDKTEEEIKHEI